MSNEIVTGFEPLGSPPPQQQIKEIIVIMQNARSVEILCNEINRNIYTIYDDWCGMDVSQNYIELFELLSQLQGYILASFDFGKIDRKQYAYVQQSVRDITKQFQLRMFKVLPVVTAKKIIDKSVFPILSDSIC